MDMGTGKTDKLIAAAIAGLPYRRPSAGFRARVLAAIEAQAAADARLGWVLKGIGAVTAAWAGALVTVSAGPAWRFLADYASIAVESGAAQALRLIAARGALLLAKLAAAGSVAADLAGLALAQLPPVYEVAGAAVISAAVIRALTAHGPSAQKI
ncbi:MAG: hypothetical protein A2X31_12965 [Elusimicrobia bacterium GWB2_63_22]|nr:MAG: hypothetical protein A2X31_12965 [Elusimicrobia bacterium GWB2_63_22]